MRLIVSYIFLQSVAGAFGRFQVQKVDSSHSLPDQERSVNELTADSKPNTKGVLSEKEPLTRFRVHKVAESGVTASTQGQIGESSTRFIVDKVIASPVQQTAESVLSELNKFATRKLLEYHVNAESLSDLFPRDVMFRDISLICSENIAFTLKENTQIFRLFMFQILKKSFEDKNYYNPS